MNIELAKLATETLNDVSTPDGEVGVIDALSIDGSQALIWTHEDADKWYDVSTLEAGHDLLYNARLYGVSTEE